MNNIITDNDSINKPFFIPPNKKSELAIDENLKSIFIENFDQNTNQSEIKQLENHIIKYMDSNQKSISPKNDREVYELATMLILHIGAGQSPSLDKAYEKLANRVFQSEHEGIHMYVDGTISSKKIVPFEKNQKLGSGTEANIYRHEKNVDWVVKRKKATFGQEKNFYSQMEFIIGKKLDHPMLVKYHDIYIKKYLNSDKEKHTIVREGFSGELLDEKENLRLDKEQLKLFLLQLKDCALYLYDHDIIWRDFHGKNIAYTKEGIQLFDYGLWKESKNGLEKTNELIAHAMYAVETLLGVSNISQIDHEKITLPREYNLITSYQIDPRMKEKIENLNNDEQKKFIGGYFDAVIRAVDKGGLRKVQQRN